MSSNEGADRFQQLGAGWNSSVGRAILDSMQDALILRSGDGTVLFINSAGIKLFGLTDASEAFKLQTEFLLFELDGRQLDRAEWPYARSIRGEPIVNVELRVRQEGRFEWVGRFSANSLRAESGEVTLAIVSIRDVTSEWEWRQFENARLRALAATGLGTWHWDLRAGYLSFSELGSELLGTGRERTVSTSSFFSLLHPDDHAPLRLAAESALRVPNEKIDVEFRVVLPNGAVRWVQAWGSSRPGVDGSPGFIDGVIASISEKKAADQELRQTAVALRSILEASPLAIITVCPLGRVQLWNQSAERILGHRAADVVGQPCPFFIERGAEVHHREIHMSRADGTQIEVACSSAPMLGPAGETLGNVVMFSDMTDRNRMKRRLDHTQRLESLGVLAAGVAHDFNNLLTGIMGNASLSLYAVDDGSEVRPLLDEIVRSSERAAALTRQLLAYAGKGRLNPAKVSLTDLAEETASLPFTEESNRKIKVQFNLDCGLPELTADPVQIRQVILSLVTNAIEAMGGETAGWVRVTTRSEIITESTPQPMEVGDPLIPGLYAILEISDNGSGMDESTRARIFEPFFSTKFTGRGLGLSSVLGIVRQHKGALQVETAPGVGSTFRVLLPIATEAEITRVHSPQSKDLEGEGLILVVDDEDAVRRPVRRALERLNYQVVLAENGQAAVEAFSQIADDVRAVILDLTMPVMGGEEALGHLQRIRPDVQIILTSGYSESDAMVRMGNRGVAGFLQKPFDAEQVGRKLRELLRKRVNRDPNASELHRQRESVGDR